MPLARFFRISSSMWPLSSSSRSCSNCRRFTKARSLIVRSVQFISSQPHDPFDRGAESVPIVRFDFQLFATLSREAIESGAAAKLRYAPLGFDPALMLETVERGVERSLVDLQHI